MLNWTPVFVLIVIFFYGNSFQSNTHSRSFSRKICGSWSISCSNLYVAFLFILAKINLFENEKQNENREWRINYLNFSS